MQFLMLQIAVSDAEFQLPVFAAPCKGNTAEVLHTFGTPRPEKTKTQRFRKVPFGI